MTYQGSGDPARRRTLFDGSEVERTDYRPVGVNQLARTTLLSLSRLIGEHFAGTPYGEHFASCAPE
jgi:hypothetical protein